MPVLHLAVKHNDRQFIPLVYSHWQKALVQGKEQPDIILYNCHKQYNHLQAVVMTGPDEWKMKVQGNTLVASIDYKMNNAQYKHNSCHVNFGLGSRYNKRVLIFGDQTACVHSALVEACVETLKVVEKICNGDAKIHQIVVKTPSRRMVEVMAWRRSISTPRFSTAEVKAVRGLYAKLEEKFRALERQGRQVQFWLVK